MTVGKSTFRNRAVAKSSNSALPAPARPGYSLAERSNSLLISSLSEPKGMLIDQFPHQGQTTD